MKHSLKMVLGGVLIASAALTAGQSVAFERVDGEKIMVIAGRQGVQVLDPSVKYDATIRTLQQAVYDGLVKYEGTPPKIKPWLAESWSTSDDGLVWTFNLTKNVKFHNGDPLDAEAVRFSFERTLKLNKGPAWMLSAFLKPENIQALDAHTIQFTLDKPYSPLISFMPWWYIMNPKQVMSNEVDGDFGQKWLIDHEAGSGPFILKRFEQGKLYELTRVKDYWKGFPYEGNKLGGIIYKLIRESSSQRAALIRGEADIVTDLSPDEFDAVAKRGGFTTSTNPALTAFGLKFNTKGEYMSDKNLRKAVAWAFDYSAFDKIYNGKAKLQTSPFTDGIKGKITVPGMPRHDVAKAKEYLAKSKWPNGGIELDYVYVQGLDEERLMGLVLIDSLKDINITVKMVPLTWPNMVALGSKVETSPDMLAIFATPVSNDPDAVAMQYHPDSWGKYYGSSFYDNKEVHKLIEKARFTTNWDERAKLYAQIQIQIVEDQPEIFGMMRERRIIYHKYVKGFNYSPVRMTTEIDYHTLHIDN